MLFLNVILNHGQKAKNNVANYIVLMTIERQTMIRHLRNARIRECVNVLVAEL